MSFDTLAPFYRWMERVCAGSRLHRCRCAFLGALTLPDEARILMLGEGHGRFLVECLGKFPQSQITYVDASAVMITQAQKAVQAAGLRVDRVTFIHIDALTWKPPHAAFDLIVTHFFLDCFRPDQLERLIPTIARAARPAAHWLVADFQEAPHGWRRLRSSLILAMMYVFFRVVTRLPARRLTCPDPLLTKAGFTLHREVTFEWGLLRSAWWCQSLPLRH